MEPGCPTLVEFGARCPVHAAARAQRVEERRQAERREYDAQRPGPRQRGYDKRHEEWREKILRRDPMCVMRCGRRSTVADHKVPIREKGPRFSMTNGQGMCELCHNAKRQEESTRAKRRAAR